MLCLTRAVTERIFIGDGICIEVLEIGRGQVKLGISAPAEVKILREELARNPHLAPPPAVAGAGRE